ncbi:phosphatase and actin regulator 2 [Trichonephila clavipes]|nr:phosphatase and actin regulator 2 [Trichonephila clavipes]
MYKNALKEDLIRVVENLDGTVESTDTIAKLKTKIENSSTFESDPDFVKTLIQNCIDERVSRNEREATLEKQKIELAKLQLAKLEKEAELQTAKNEALSLNLLQLKSKINSSKLTENMIKSETYIQFAARLTANFKYYCSLRKVNSFESLCDLIISDKLFETLNKETATHIGIREAEDWFRPIDLAKECDIYISSKNGSQNQPVTALIDSGCQIPVLNSSLIRVNQPSEEIITLSSCFGEQRIVEVKPINISLNQLSPSLSVRTAISPTLTEEIIIHPSVYAEIKKLGHAKSDVLWNESESSLGAVSVSNVSVSSVIKNSSYDLPHVKNFNTRNDSSSLIKNYKCNKIKSTKLKLSIVREKCSDIVLCKKVNGAMKTSSVEFISRSPTPSPMKSKQRRFALLRRIFEPWQWKRRKKRDRFEQTSRTLERKISMRSSKELIKKDVLMPVKHNVFSFGLQGRTAADSVQSGCRLWHAAKSNLRAQAQQIQTRTETLGLLRDERKEKHRAQPLGQPIGVNVHCTLHPIREQALSSQPSQKLTTQMKNISHASRIPSLDQSPTCHSAEWKTPLLQTLTIWD